MKKVVANLKQGKKTDQALYLIGYAIVIMGFLTMYNLGIWEASKSNWRPITGLGFSIIIITFLFSLVRDRLNIDILKNEEKTIIVTPMQKLLFSGWGKLPPVEIEKRVIESVNLDRFQIRGREFYGVQFYSKEGKILELQIKELDVADAIIEFSKKHLSDSKITVNGK